MLGKSETLSLLLTNLECFRGLDASRRMHGGVLAPHRLRPEANLEMVSTRSASTQTRQSKPRFTVDQMFHTFPIKNTNFFVTHELTKI